MEGDEATSSGLKVTQIINHPQVKGNKKKISVHEAGGNIVNLIIKLAAWGFYIETQSEISTEKQKEKGETREDWE